MPTKAQSPPQMSRFRIRELAEGLFSPGEKDTSFGVPGHFIIVNLYQGKDLIPRDRFKVAGEDNRDIALSILRGALMDSLENLLKDLGVELVD